MIEYHRISKKLFWGYEACDGVNLACPEKAFLDLVYIRHLKGRFSLSQGKSASPEQPGRQGCGYPRYGDDSSNYPTGSIVKFLVKTVNPRIYLGI